MSLLCGKAEEAHHVYLIANSRIYVPWYRYFEKVFLLDMVAYLRHHQKNYLIVC